MSVSLLFAKRQLKRRSAFLHATLSWDGGASRAIVRNLSRDGAMIELDIAPAVGSSITLIIGDYSIEAEVTRTEQGRLGLRFFETLAIDVWLQLAGSGMAVAAPRDYRTEPAAYGQ